MKSLRSLLVCALALSFFPSLASADEASLTTWVERRVKEGLIKPLAKKEEGRSRFSRSAPPPDERRARALQSTASVDKQNRAFVPFAIDIRYGSEWQKGGLVGCAYRSSGEIFVKLGDSYRPASFLLGKDAAPVAGVCEPAPAPPPPSA